MTVAELIEFLKKQPQDLRVAVRANNEHYLLEQDDIDVTELCKPRINGRILYPGPGMKTERYLSLPGSD